MILSYDNTGYDSSNDFIKPLKTRVMIPVPEKMI